jgi:esterase/lipase superfamily enzyme
MFAAKIDIWGSNMTHDWPSWREYIAKHLPRFV